MAEAELSDVRPFGAPRALGIALPAGIEAMTPSEMRIVRLAVDGRSNRDIAHELYVTVKTVEGHLSRAYSKLGIEGRPQLAGVVRAAKTRVPTL